MYTVHVQHVNSMSLRDMLNMYNNNNNMYMLQHVQQLPFRIVTKADVSENRRAPDWHPSAAVVHPTGLAMGKAAQV